jgi:hypothetical protein
MRVDVTRAGRDDEPGGVDRFVGVVASRRGQTADAPVFDEDVDDGVDAVGGSMTRPPQMARLGMDVAPEWLRLRFLSLR